MHNSQPPPPQAGLLKWPAADGWLVLIGGTSGRWRATEAIDRAAIQAMNRSAPIAFIPAAGCPPDYGESFLARYAELGAPDGYVVPIHDTDSAREPDNVERLAQAGLIYIGGGETPALLDAMTGSPALHAIAAAHKAGTVVVGMSAGAIALAAWGLSIDPRVGLLKGWGWLPDVIVSPHYTRERSQGLRAALDEHPEMLGLGLPEHVALALGPGGEEQIWGGERICIMPGPNVRTDP